MLLAGLSEAFIIGAILYALKTLPSHSRFMGVIFQLSLLITLTASLFGAIKFLTDLDVSRYHGLFTYLSKHLALTAFIIGAAWQHFESNLNKNIAYLILVSAFVSLLLNIKHELSLVSMIIMLLAIAFTLLNLKSNSKALIRLSLATVVLLSTLIWGALISNKDLLIAVYHLCVGGFYLLSTLSFSQQKGEK